MLADPLAEPGPLGAVEAGGGLVEQQDVGLGDAGPGDGDELALALAEVAGGPVAQRADADAVERGGDGVVAVGAGGAEGGDADVLLDREVVVELERLERAAQAGAHPGVRLEVRRCPSPSSWTVPRAGAKPVMASITLVLPAPFGPMSPTTAPAATSSETSLTATTPP